MVNDQQDIMSVCLAVVRGLITPDQAREAILGRTSSEPVYQSLRLQPALRQEAAEITRLPAGERDECLDLFKDLYSQPPEEVVLREDEELASMLLRHHLISSIQAEECLAIQKQVHEKGVRPLPRVGELLIRKGFLAPGGAGGSNEAVEEGPSSSEEAKRPHPRLPSPVQEALSQPDTRFGRYIRTSLLGQGGAGEVWKSWDAALERWVALKFLKFENTEELARLKREAQTAARLSHPCIARVFEIGEARDRTFLALEYVEGQTLETYPRHDPRKLVSLLRDAALAIHYAHGKGIVHRDLKPGNIMVDASGRVFVMDFGLARQIESKRSLTGRILGTPTYMPPEQATGGAADLRSDVYSLGATLYELLADRPPFQGRNVFDTLDKVVTSEPAPLPHIAAELQTIVSKCLMKEPSRRYASAADLAEDLRRWLEGEAILAHPPSLFYRLRKRAAKWKAAIAVGVAGVLVAAGIAGWVIPQWLRADRAESLKGKELAAEKEGRARSEQAIGLARPHLDEGRRLQTRLDRLLTTETWTRQDVRSLVNQTQQELDRALALYPDHPDALLEKSRVFQYENNRAAAVEFCTRAIEASHGFATAHLQRARLRLDQYEELRHALTTDARPEVDQKAAFAAMIRADLKEVQSWSKDARELTFANGALAFVEGQFERAAGQLEEYSRLTLSDYRGWEWTAHAWLRVPGMEAKAVDALSEALKYRPRLPSLLIFRGTAQLQASIRFRRQQEMERSSRLRSLAIDDFRSARDIDPLEAGAHRGLGEACLEAGEGSLAAAHFTQALGINPKDPAALVGRARARFREGDIAGASADADELFRLGSGNPRSLVIRGRVRCAKEDPDGAWSDLSRALQEAPQDAEARVGLGDVKMERADARGAIEEYNRAISLDPGSAEAYHHRGIAERDLGDAARAQADLTKALSLDPGNAWIYYDRGIEAGHRREWLEALTDFRKGLARMPADPTPFWLRIWLARSRLGEPDAARDELAASAADMMAANPDHLFSKLVALLVGRLSLQTFLGELDPTARGRGELARAYFYAGERAALEGNLPSAADLWNRCLKTRAATSDHATAEAELRQLPAFRQGNP